VVLTEEVAEAEEDADGRRGGNDMKKTYFTIAGTNYYYGK